MFKFNTAGLHAAQAAFIEKVQGEVAMAGAAGMALVMRDEVKLNASQHHQSGDLGKSIYRVYSPETSSRNLKSYRISWNKKKAPEGYFLEFGTAHAPAYPFLRPSLSRVHDAIAYGQARMIEKLAEIKGNS